jgi:signal transduction histidine kinase
METLLALAETGPAERAEKWRRIFFSLAEHPPTSLIAGQAIDYLRSRKEEIGIARRSAWAASIGIDAMSPLLADFLGKEDPEVHEAAHRGESAGNRASALFGGSAVGKPGNSERFRWESDESGVIRWAEGLPRATLIGANINSGILGDEAASAFGRRAPFRNGRFILASSPAVAEWVVSGVPHFKSNGSCQGYRGMGRRLQRRWPAAEANEKPGLFGTDLPPDALRQLIHELRTPLNAIAGFAEMIEDQHLGPAEDRYRERAAQIRNRAAHLISAIDDLDTAARIETSRLMVEEASVDAEALLRRLAAAYQPVAGRRGARIGIDISVPLPPVLVENGNAERMFARLLAATIGLVREGETIQATLKADTERRQVLLAIQRPHAIAGLSEQGLLDPGFSPEGEWPGAPALGLGFALRLVRNLAEAVGGSLEIGDQGFRLSLPADPANGQDAK